MGRFLTYTKDLPSTNVFRLATALHAVGSAVERRVWTEIDTFRDYPNMFIFLIGEPNTGKTAAMSKMSPLVIKANYPFWLGPKIASKQGMIDELNKPECSKTVLDKNMDIVDGRYMALYWPEIANAMPENNPAITGLLTDLWDCPDVIDEGLRVAKGKRVEMPGGSLLVGAAIDKLNRVFPPNTWGDGFMSRAIMVHSTDLPPSRNRFKEVPINAVLEGEIIELFKKLGGMVGRMQWSLRAQDLYNDWADANPDPPGHRFLQHYVSRRPRHLCKFMMVSALNELRMEVDAEDFENATAWMRLFESNMGDIFINMIKHDDAYILDEIGQRVADLYYSNGRQEVSMTEIATLLSNIGSHLHIKSLLEVAEQTGRIKRVAGATGSNAEYTPGDRFRRGR